MAKWKEAAAALINGGWYEGQDSPDDFIKRCGDQRLILCLLIDVAESLRVLRCSNFTAIPRKLDAIRRATEGLRRDSAIRSKRRVRTGRKWK